MLYNQKWTETLRQLFVEPKKEEIFSLSRLINWLEQKPRDRVYNYDSCYDCLIGKYLKDLGFQSVYLDSHSYSYQGQEELAPLPRHWDYIGMGTGYTTDKKNWTYGAALDRAKKIQNEELEFCENLYKEIC